MKTIKQNFETIVEICCWPTSQKMRKVFLGLTFSGLLLVLFMIQYNKTINFKTLHRSEKSGYDLFPCHCTNLQPCYYGNYNQHKEHTSCRPHVTSKRSCQVANKFFGNPNQNLSARTCPTHPKQHICSFKSTGTITLLCKQETCGSSEIFMGKRDSKYGDIRKWTKMTPFTVKKAEQFVKTALEEGETFCFFKCGSILQVLVFPLHLYIEKTGNNASSEVSINIILIDSISRTHFYRMLRQSVSSLRNIMNDKMATVLDFKLFQSISTHTFENIRALFSGAVVDGKYQRSSHLSEIGLHVLYKHFKSRGYQTVFQEDLCWYDRWGTVLDNIKTKGTSKPSVKRWFKFKEFIKKHHIDNFGLTFFSCEVFKQFDDTNHFETPAKVCLNGKFFNSYFLQYLQDLTSTVRTSQDAPPYVSYLHFNTGHTRAGTRIRNLDQNLAHFINVVGRDPWTWTIILADHGHKTTEYARNTEDGPYEATNPLLFMIIPHNVAKVLGETSMAALKLNQNRLITSLDIHHTLMTFLDKTKSGLLVNITANRTCSDVPLMPLAKCQCFGNEERYEDNSPKYLWMAEFAVGELNNQIQRQFSKGGSTGGNSNCKRLIGSSFRNIIQTGTHTTFDLHVNASHVGINHDEVFKVAIATLDKGARLQSYERITLYNKFKDCVDKSVDIKLCTCDRIPGRSKQTLENSIRTKMFRKSRTTVKKLYNNCLFHVTRHYSDVTFAIEVFNNCKKKSFKVKADGYTEQLFMSRAVPFAVTVKPQTIQFLYSATTQAAYYHNSVEVEVTAVINATSYGRVHS